MISQHDDDYVNIIITYNILFSIFILFFVCF